MAEREALILAAGLGTRLGKLTAETPKALIEVGGVPMLERVARRLIAAGVDRLVINTHHHAGRIEEYVRVRRGFGAEFAFSREEDAPLETGGGLRRAAPLLTSDAPFFVHNADIFTDLPLEALYARHLASDPLATLAVMNRESSRGLLFDDLGLLGRVDDGRGIDLRVRVPVGMVRRVAFAGVHVIAPRLPRLLTERGAFSILVPYLRLAEAGHRIEPFAVDGSEWIDIGKPDQLAEADRRAERSLPSSRP